MDNAGRYLENADKYLFDLSDKKYNDRLWELLLEYNFGVSVLNCLEQFNLIQDTIINYYKQIKEHKSFGQELYKNSLLFVTTVHDTSFELKPFDVAGLTKKL